MNSKDPDFGLDPDEDLNLELYLDHNLDLDLDLWRIVSLKVTYSGDPFYLIFFFNFRKPFLSTKDHGQSQGFWSSYKVSENLIMIRQAGASQ